jgi:uncharacterized protein (TIGR00255 family)
MIRSMTGYGKTMCDLPGKKITIEIKSLNSKQFDWNSKIPLLYREWELEMKSIVAKKLERGKVDFYMSIENTDGTASYSLDEDRIKKYYSQLLDLSKGLKTAQSDILQLVMRLPDVIKTEKEELKEDEWQSIGSTINIAMDELDAFRKEEGKILENDFKERINKIISLLDQVEPYEQERINHLKERIRKNLFEYIDKEKIDQNRFEQELFYYIEKIDITEEKVRLKKHVDFFLDTLKNPESAGKKLGFVTQEIGREINTLGSKANNFNIQAIVVQMKDELEKVKEQLLNIL